MVGVPPAPESVDFLHDLVVLLGILDGVLGFLGQQAAFDQVIEQSSGNHVAIVGWNLMGIDVVAPAMFAVGVAQVLESDDVVANPRGDLIGRCA